MRLIQDPDSPLEPEEFSIRCSLRELRDILFGLEACRSPLVTDTIRLMRAQADDILMTRLESPAEPVRIPAGGILAHDCQLCFALRSDAPPELRRAGLTTDNYPPVITGQGSYARGWPDTRPHTKELIGRDPDAVIAEAVLCSEPRAQATGPLPVVV